MQLGIIRLERIGSPIARHLIRAGQKCAVRDTHLQPVIDEAIPAPAIRAALFTHFASRGSLEIAVKLTTAMLFRLGEHLEKPISKLGAD